MTAVLAHTAILLACLAIASFLAACAQDPAGNVYPALCVNTPPSPSWSVLEVSEAEILEIDGNRPAYGTIGVMGKTRDDPSVIWVVHGLDPAFRAGVIEHEQCHLKAIFAGHPWNHGNALAVQG
jgi:hypothetical protein